mgnify:FL=1
MKLIVCIDEKKGMMFNHRRQSQDRVLRDDIRKECQGSILRMNAYSAGLFEKDADVETMVQIFSSEDFLAQASEDDCCFVEDQDISLWLEQADTVILYQWNRHYPADLYFTAELSEDTWQMERQEDFAGSSHEKITKTVYAKRHV